MILGMMIKKRKGEEMRVKCKSIKDIEALNLINSIAKKLAVRMRTDEITNIQKSLYYGLLEHGREWLKSEIKRLLRFKHSFFKPLPYLFIPIIFLFLGCAAKSPKPKVVHKVLHIKKEKPYRFTYKPIIGTQNDDEKITVDMGVVLRVWINSYKDTDGSLIASHDTYIWAKRPDFIVGAQLPSVRRGLVTPTGIMPFMLSNESIDRSNFKNDENIKSYVNSVYEKSSKKETLKRLEKRDVFDRKIKEFLKEKTK
jgi:hypothetical protein